VPSSLSTGNVVRMWDYFLSASFIYHSHD